MVMIRRALEKPAAARLQVVRLARGFLCFQVILQRSLPIGGKREELKAVVVAVLITNHCAQLPRQGRARQQEIQPYHIPNIQLRCQKNSDAGLRQIPAVSLDFLVVVSQETAYSYAEVRAVPLMPSAAAVNRLFGDF